MLRKSSLNIETLEIVNKQNGPEDQYIDFRSLLQMNKISLNKNTDPK